MKEKRKALLVVDVQRDFCPGGALAVRQGDTIVEPLNRVIKTFEEANLPIIYTRDWHPKNHISFRAQGGVWPPHCVKNTPGARFHLELHIPKLAMIVSKGTEVKQEAYSGFQGTNMTRTLRSLGVREVFVGGLATDYCVVNTVLDALDNGFRATLISDCVRGVNVKKTDSANAFRSMLSHGAKRIRASQVTP